VTTAAIYCRISYDRTGEGLGVERQEAECRALAERLGMTIAGVYVDNDISATSGVARPAFDQLLESKPSAIIAWHQDRLLRLTRDLERVIALNVPIYTVTAGTLDLATPAGRAVARTVAAWSQYEGEQKGERQVAANGQRAATGVHNGRVGYGYRREGKAMVLDPAESEVIREAVRRVLDGESLRSICKELNERGIPSPRAAERDRAREQARAENRPEPTYGTPDPLWNTTTLRQMLLRTNLAGLIVHRKQVVGRAPVDAPRVIDEDTHERLRAVLNDPRRRTSPVGRSPKYLLGGIARCGKCGGVVVRLVGRMTRTSTGTKRQPPAYACSECHGVRRKQDLVDAVVEGIVVRRLEQPDALDLFSRGDESAVADSRAALEAIDARLSNAADAYAAGALELDQLTRITAQLRADRGVHVKLLERSMPSAVPVDLAGDRAAERWAAMSMDAKRALLQMLVRVTILPSGPGRDFDPELVRIDWLSEAE